MALAFHSCAVGDDYGFELVKAQNCTIAMLCAALGAPFYALNADAPRFVSAREMGAAKPPTEKSDETIGDVMTKLGDSSSAIFQIGADISAAATDFKVQQPLERTKYLILPVVIESSRKRSTHPRVYRSRNARKFGNAVSTRCFDGHSDRTFRCRHFFRCNLFET
eukprot:TRINITY_DN76799_c0_g1_i1.p1 TRINITY_DN76799_c0_g1~~TRINITY_DN76799_c0_g1_i1.p1  ORF type:complete len:187 (+),score=10.25 TRINITY_DN76799_c0_g1_i1:68-562(+)